MGYVQVRTLATLSKNGEEKTLPLLILAVPLAFAPRAQE